ncbi:hypothetical protein TNCV_405371 [Trichonephila clavipes]|nr:hypothetical protein TNCV_405371 [Trichonephila clavipes]
MIAGAGTKGAFSQKDGRKRKTIIEFGSNQEISPTERGGRTYPKTRTLYRSKAPAGGGEEGRKEGGTAEGSESEALDTLRENCGIIRKQASTDGGVLWKVMCVDVVQVRRKNRSLRDPREARSRVRI